MTSPQENYSYEKLIYYLDVARLSLSNFKLQYPDLSVSVRQPESEIAGILKAFSSGISEALHEKNAYLEPEEIDGIEIGSRVGFEDKTKHNKLSAKIEEEKKLFREELFDLVHMHIIRLKGLYMQMSAISAKFTADRIQELHRREKWVKTQEHYLGLYHIKECSKWSYTKNIDFHFATRFRDIPEETGVYFIFKNGEIVYIGHSTNLHNRIRNHEIVRKYYSSDHGFDVECVYAVLPKNAALRIERKMIKLERPEYNERGK